MNIISEDILTFSSCRQLGKPAATPVCSSLRLQCEITQATLSSMQVAEILQFSVSTQRWIVDRQIHRHGSQYVISWLNISTGFTSAAALQFGPFLYIDSIQFGLGHGSSGLALIQPSARICSGLQRLLFLSADQRSSPSSKQHRRCTQCFL